MNSDPFHDSIIRRVAPNAGDGVRGRFKIRVARIESLSNDAPENFAQVTFRIDGETGSFYFPVLVNQNEFDEADLTKVARNILHENLMQLSHQTEKWKLTEDELRQLSYWKFYQGA